VINPSGDALGRLMKSGRNVGGRGAAALQFADMPDKHMGDGLGMGVGLGHFGFSDQAASGIAGRLPDFQPVRPVLLDTFCRARSANNSAPPARAMSLRSTAVHEP
jgi:hypothetical protein